jgi:ComF family protein
MMAQGWGGLAPNCGPIDAVVPVPLHRARQRERGFNQSAHLARQLGAHFGWPVVEGVLVRARPTVPQVGLEPAQRRTNVAGAFHCIDGSLAGKRLLLVDDVRTTGATLEAASLALHQGGAASIWAYTLACAAGSGSGDSA